jgi:probable rRNA maturation factor
MSETDRDPDPAAPGCAIILAEPGWRRVLRRPEERALRAVRAVGLACTVVLASDTQVKRLNARYRRRNAPTNVLSFESAVPGRPGEILLALGTIRREAAAQEKSLAAHVTHLVVHGALHLRGHDHVRAAAARRMESLEARTLRRLGFPNPWKRA